jgi:hypothetical protein
MKPYGQKLKKASSSKIHKNDDCGICSNDHWKKNRAVEKRKVDEEILLDMNNNTPKKSFALKPRHRWFMHFCKNEPDVWDGPFKTIDLAIDALNRYPYTTEEYDTIYLCQGRKITKKEKEIMGVEYDWECETFNCLEINLPL